MLSTKDDFLKHLGESGFQVIWRRLRMSAGRFWRAVKGSIVIALPVQLVQLELFECK